MYRLRLEPEHSDQWQGHYRLVHCDLDTFVNIACGQRQLAEITDPPIQDPGQALAAWYYTAVWNPDTASWVNDLNPDLAVTVYESWSRPNFA